MYVWIERVSFGVQDMLTDVAVGYDTILNTTLQIKRETSSACHAEQLFFFWTRF